MVLGRGNSEDDSKPSNHNLSAEEIEKLRLSFNEATEIIDKRKLWDKKPGSVKYDGEFIKVVEIPMFATGNAWSIVDLIVAKGFTIKAVVEREYWKTSLVILEYQKKTLPHSD